MKGKLIFINNSWFVNSEDNKILPLYPSEARSYKLGTLLLEEKQEVEYFIVYYTPGANVEETKYAKLTNIPKSLIKEETQEIKETYNLEELTEVGMDMWRSGHIIHTENGAKNHLFKLLKEISNGRKSIS